MASTDGPASQDGKQSATREEGNPKLPPTDPASKQRAENDDASSQNTPSETWRQIVGRQMHTVSDIINDNLIAARYATFASIALLTAYGVAHTPLFFRFKTVAEIPASYFLRRRTIHGRLVRVIDDVATEKGDSVEKPIVCLVRHLSPMGRLLNRSSFDFFMRSNPASAVGKALEENTHELLKVEIAGVKQPPFYMAPGYVEQPGEWLCRLAEQRAPMSCQLLARRAQIDGAPKRRDARALAEFQQSIVGNEQQTAICRIRYRPGRHILKTDVAESLVRHGRASLSSSGMFVSSLDNNWTIVDTSDRVEDLKKDTKYMHRLEKAEYEAAKESAGMWADPFVRDSRQDLIEEVEFEKEASRFQKVWRWLRG